MISGFLSYFTPTFDLVPSTVLVKVMITFTSILLMKPIAANYSNNLNWLAMMGVF